MAATALAKRFGSLDAVMAATREELTAIDDFGEIMADSLLNFWAHPQSAALVEKLRAAGLTLTPAKDYGKIGNTLAGLTFVITGTLPTLSREQATERIKDAGGKVSGSVSSKTDYLVCGEAAGSKLTRARELGVTIIDEEQLRQMLSEESV